MKHVESTEGKGNQGQTVRANHHLVEKRMAFKWPHVSSVLTMTIVPDNRLELLYMSLSQLYSEMAEHRFRGLPTVFVQCGRPMIMVTDNGLQHPSSQSSHVKAAPFHFSIDSDLPIYWSGTQCVSSPCPT